MKTATILMYGTAVVYIQYCAVCLKHRLYDNMLIIHLFSFITIKTPRDLVALAPFGILIMKTLTNVLLTITYHG